MSELDFPDRLMREAKEADLQAGVDAILKYKGQPFSSTKRADIRVRTVVVAVLKELEKRLLEFKDDYDIGFAAELNELAAEIKDRGRF